MPEVNFGSTSKKQNKVKDYIEKNKFFTGMVSITVIVLIIVAVVIAITYNNESVPTNAESQTNIDISKSQDIEVLPQVQRIEGTKQNENSNGKKKPIDPFTGPMVLKGTIIGDNGNNQALILTGGVSYVVKVNGKIGNTWTVKKIDRKEVLLGSGDKELTLTLTENRGTSSENQSNANSTQNTNTAGNQTNSN